MPTRQDYERVLKNKLELLEKEKNQKENGNAAGDGSSRGEADVRAKNKQRQSA